MANKLISELTAVASVVAADEVEVQKSGETTTKKATVTQLLAPEATARAAQDDVIEASCGLETNGTLAALSDSWYLRAADLTTGYVDRAGSHASVTNNVANLIKMLDAEIHGVSQQLTGISSLVSEAITVEAVEILALNTVPKVLISCPTDSIIEVLSVSARLNDGGTPFSAGSDVLSVRYASNQTLFEFPNAFIESASSICYRGVATANQVLAEDEDVVLYCAANPTLGNGTMTVWVTYIVHDIPQIA